MLIFRCPRCRAQDISADAHPTRVLNNGRLTRILVCRECYRPAELELRIACDAAGVALESLPIREGLAMLADHYLDRLAAIDDPELLIDDAERTALRRPVRAALAEARRKLSLEVVP